MSAITFACPECHTLLKPARPIPTGKKVRCPKCSHVFSPPLDKSQVNVALQAKPRGSVPAQRGEEAENAGWELVEDEAAPSSPKPPGEAIPLAQPDKPKRDTQPDQEKYDDRPRRKLPRKPQRFDKADAKRADDFDAEDDEEQPRKKKRRKHNVAGVHQLVKLYLILGVVTLLLLAGGGGLAAWLYINWDKNRGTGNEDPLAYIPADSRIVMGFDVGTLMKQPSIAAYVEKSLRENSASSGNFVKEIQNQTGLEFKDLFDRTLVAIKPPAAPGQGPETRTLILKSRVAFDQHKIRNSSKNPTAQRYKGKTYFKITDDEFTTLLMPSNWLIILTNVPEAQVQALIDSNGSQPGLPADALTLAQEAAQSHLWGVAPFDANIKQTIQRQMGQAGPMLPANFGATLSRAKGASLSGTLEGNTVRFQVSLACTDEPSAKQAADGLQNVWDKQGKGQVALMTAVVPKFMGSFLKELTDSLQFSSQGTIAHAAAQVSVPTLETLMKEAQNQPAGGFQPEQPGRRGKAGP